jgi:hypothetical protein
MTPPTSSAGKESGYGVLTGANISIVTTMSLLSVIVIRM